MALQINPGGHAHNAAAVGEGTPQGAPTGTPGTARRRVDNTLSRVREAREMLSHGYGAKPEYQKEMLSKFVQNELAANLTIPLIAMIIALATAFWAPMEEAVAWFAILMLARLNLVHRCRQFAAQPIGEIDVVVSRSRLTFAELLYGCAWAGVVCVGVNPAGDTAHVFVFAALIVVLTMRLLFASTVMEIVYAGTVPMTLALVIRFMLLNDPFYWAMASMAIGIHVYFIFLAKGLHATVLQMFEYRAEKDHLIAELEEASSISDEARRRAEEANVAKSRFLATMSHELRTPLNAILGFSEVMNSELLGKMRNPTYKDYAGSIHESGTHLLHLINEILDLSRIEAGKHDLVEEPIRLLDIAEDCHRLLNLRSEAKKLNIIEKLEHSLEPIWADERAFRQIVLNLLSNAIKFTPHGGTITLETGRMANGDQFVAITDTGPGIPKEEIPKVLKAFGQGSLAHTNAEGGTGLGLPIVRSLVELHGGKFHLESELRIGTRVWATVPASRRLMQLSPLQPLGRETHRRAPDQPDAGTSPDAGSPAAPPPLHQPAHSRTGPRTDNGRGLHTLHATTRTDAA